MLYFLFNIFHDLIFFHNYIIIFFLGRRRPNKTKRRGTRAPKPRKRQNPFKRGSVNRRDFSVPDIIHSDYLDIDIPLNEFELEEAKEEITRTVTQKIVPFVSPKTKWFDSPTQIRHNWSRPCSLNQNFVIVSDSLGRAAVNSDIFCNNLTFCSYSGSCLLENLLLMASGSLTNAQTGKLITEDGGRSYFGNANISDIPFQKYCSFCNQCCWDDFAGTFCYALGTNNIIKSDRLTYRNQNLRNIIHLAESVLNKLAPKATVRFVFPPQPTSHLFLASDNQQKAHRDFCWDLQWRNTAGPSPNHLINHKWHSRDGIHIRHDAVTKYWNIVLNDLTFE